MVLEYTMRMYVYKSFRDFILKLGINWFINNNLALDLGFNIARFNYTQHKYGFLQENN